MFVSIINNSISNSFKIKSKPVYNTPYAGAKTVSFKGCDTFEKTDVQDTKEITSVKWSEQELKSVYDKTYKEVMEQNPLSKELNIEKPKFKLQNFDSETEDSKEFAGYIFPSNEMVISSSALNDLFLCTVVKNNEHITLGIFDEKNIENALAAVKKYGYEFKTKKLSNKEKEAFLKTALAHELRHCIQMHLIASTKGCSKLYRTLIEKSHQIKCAQYGEIQECNEMLKKTGLDDKIIDVDPPDISYLDNFVPKKVITDDAKLKFSMSPKDNRYLSTKDHLLQYTLITFKQVTPEIYKASPVEMDANNYAYQYFCTKVKKNPEFKDMSPAVSDEIQNFYFDRAKNAKVLMKQFGFRDLITKND